MNRQQQRNFDLPLIFNPNINKRLPQERNKDLPRQLKNDLYRVSSKENIPYPRGPNNSQQPYEQLNKIPLGVSNHIKSSNKKDADQLKQIIRRKLHFNNKISANIPKNAKNIPKEPKITENRYQMLLKEFYGAPGKARTNNVPQVEQKAVGEAQLKRYQSARSLKTSEPQQKKLTRMRSHSSLKSSGQLTSKAPSSRGKPCNYLDLYMQKRKGILFL